MSHELHRNIAALEGVGVWHGMVNRMQPGMSIEEWATQSGLDFDCLKVPAVAAWESGFEPSDQYFIGRKDNHKILSRSTVTDVYQIVQPRAVLEFARDYLLNDPRFQLETAFPLRHGDTIVVTARFQDDSTVAGERVQMRVLLSTTFDSSGATKIKPVFTCVVCNNTLQAALGETGGLVSIRHNTKFNPKAASAQLAKVAQSQQAFKIMGDALAAAQMKHEEVAAFFKSLLDIPADAKKEDISTRKMNQFSDLSRAYGQTARERGLDARTDTPTAWLALNAVTRFVDHDRSVRNADDYAGGENEARFAAAQFGSGAQMKAQALQLLMPRIKDLVVA